MANSHSNGASILTPAVSYYRVSPKPLHAERPPDDDCNSIAVQKSSCERYANVWQHRLVRQFPDPDSSAGTALHERDKGKELLDYLQKTHIGVLIVQRIDRLFRDTVDGLLQMAHWDRTGVVVHFADQGGCSINTGTATGRLIFTVLLGQATFEREIIGERTSLAMLDYQRRGRRMGGVAPYGKSIDPNDPDRLIDNPVELKAIEAMLNLRAIGMREWATANSLNRMGARGCRGKQWTGETIRDILVRYDCDAKALRPAKPEPPQPLPVNHVQVKVPD